MRRHLFVCVGLAHALDPLFVLLFEFGRFRTQLLFDVFIPENGFKLDPRTLHTHPEVENARKSLDLGAEQRTVVLEFLVDVGRVLHVLQCLHLVVQILHDCIYFLDQELRPIWHN